MWYTVNASGDEFVRMRIRCQSHPVRACDVCSMHKPRRFFCSNQRTSNLKFGTGIYFQTFTVRLSPCNLTHIYLYFLEKLTFAMCSLPHMWQWFKKHLLSVVTHQKSFVIGTSVAHFLSSENFLFPRDMISYTIKNRTAFFWLQCGFLIFIRFSK